MSFSGATCRICHESQRLKENGEEERLFAPCACSGSIKYVHESCLRGWFHSRQKFRRSSWRCEVCNLNFSWDLSTHTRTNSSVRDYLIDTLDPKFISALFGATYKASVQFWLQTYIGPEFHRILAILAPVRSISAVQEVLESAAFHRSPKLLCKMVVGILIFALSYSKAAMVS